MKNEKRPAEASLFPSMENTRKYKETLMDSSRQDGKLYRLFKEGKLLTGCEISALLNVAAPNAIIKRLRDNGVDIADLPHPLFRRRKVFFLREKEGSLTFFAKGGAR